MKHIILIALTSLTFISCGQTESETTESKVEKKVEIYEGPQRLERVDEMSFISFMQENSDIQIVDVRTPEEFNDGYIPNAVNIDFKAADFKEKIDQLDKFKPVLIYCHSGGRSGKTLEMMKDMHFSTVLELEGGYSNYITPGN